MDQEKLNEIMNELYENGVYVPKDGEDEIIEYLLDHNYAVACSKNEFSDVPIMIKATKEFKGTYKKKEEC